MSLQPLESCHAPLSSTRSITYTLSLLAVIGPRITLAVLPCTSLTASLPPAPALRRTMKLSSPVAATLGPFASSAAVTCWPACMRVQCSAAVELHCAAVCTRTVHQQRAAQPTWHKVVAGHQVCQHRHRQQLLLTVAHRLEEVLDRLTAARVRQSPAIALVSACSRNDPHALQLLLPPQAWPAHRIARGKECANRGRWHGRRADFGSLQQLAKQRRTLAQHAEERRALARLLCCLQRARSNVRVSRWLWYIVR